MCEPAGRRKDAPSIFLPHQSEYVSHIALDIGGSLIKLAYFSRDRLESGGGRLHFVKFETARIEDCLKFIEEKKLHRRKDSTKPIRVKATGGGSFKYAEVSILYLTLTELCIYWRFGRIA